MTKGIIVVDMPKDCLHCELRSVIYVDGRGYQHCGLDKDGYACERFFKEEDLVDGFVSEWCPIKPLPEKIDKIVEQIKEVKETVWVADEVLRPEQVCDIIHEIIEIVKGGAV